MAQILGRRLTFAAVLDGLIAITLVYVAIVAFQGRRHPQPESISPPDSLPVGVLVFNELDAAPVDLRTLTDGAPSVIFVFRSDCPVCGRQRASWIDAAKMIDSTVVIIALTAQTPDSSTMNYFGEAPITVFYLQDPADLMRKFQITGVPSTVVSGSQAGILRFDIGLLSRNELENIVQMLQVL